MIQAIRFERHNVYRKDEATGFLPRLVNSLHIRTLTGVIERELLFDVGDLYDARRAAATERNLRSLGVFRAVDIDTTRSDSGLVVRVQTQDGWSTKPQFTFRSTGGQTIWRASLFEENLFGTASRLSASYRHEPDRTAVLFGFQQPRLIAGQVGLSLFYDDRSDGYIVDARVAQPYLSFESRTAWTAAAETRDERILRFFEGEPEPSDTAVRLLDGVGIAYGRAFRADLGGYLRLGLSARIWRDDFLTPDESRPSSRPGFGSLAGSLEWRHARFAVVRGFRANREEDVDLSTTVRVGLALTPKAFGYSDDGLVPSLSVHTGGLFRRWMFGYVDVNAHGRFSGAGLDSGAVQTAATLVYIPSGRHVTIFHAWAGWLHHPRPGGEFDLGLGLGPRAYELHAFSGDRGVITTAEYRFTVAEDFLKLADLGLAAYADWGGAWFSGSRRRTGWDIGVGLRIGTSRATSLTLNRIDLAYRPATAQQGAGWVLSVAKGFNFSTSGTLNR